jgi:hypothetical protein
MLYQVTKYVSALTENYCSVYYCYSITGGEKMPPIFKALATIVAWGLFVYGWLAILGGLVICGMQTTHLEGWLHQAAGVASLVLSVVVMILRKKME